MSDTTGAPCDLRARLEQGERLVGAWSSLAGAAAASLVAASKGLHYVVTDLQHGAASEADLPGICSAVAAQGVTPLVRVRSSAVGDVGRALDLGAHGVFLPNVRGVSHVAEVLGYCRYGPHGVRSYGRLMPSIPDPLRFIVLETAEALDDLDEILELDELDGVYVGPMDLAYSLGHNDTPFDDHMVAVVADVIKRCVAKGMPIGVHTGNGTDAVSYLDSGVRLVNAVADTAALAEGIARHVGLVEERG